MSNDEIIKLLNKIMNFVISNSNFLFITILISLFDIHKLFE